MKKRVLYSLLTSLAVFSTAAYAEDAPTSALTTKGYVDSGLKYVYDSIKDEVTDVQGDITNLQTALSDGNGGLVDVSDLKDTIGTAGVGNTPGTGLIGDIEDLQDAIGTAGNGNTPGTGLTGDVEALQDTVGDSTGGLVKDVADLQDTIGNDAMGTTATTVTGAIGELKGAIDGLEAASQEYIEGTGIDISQNAQGKNVVSLDLGTTQNNTTYIFKTDANGVGTWQAMEVEDSWNPGFLTNP